MDKEDTLKKRWKVKAKTDGNAEPHMRKDALKKIRGKGEKMIKTEL